MALRNDKGAIMVQTNAQRQAAWRAKRAAELVELRNGQPVKDVRSTATVRKRAKLIKESCAHGAVGKNGTLFLAGIAYAKGITIDDAAMLIASDKFQTEVFCSTVAGYVIEARAWNESVA